MNGTRVALLLILLAVSAGSANRVEAEPSARWSERLIRASTELRSVPGEAEGRLAVWIYFQDKGLAAGSLDASLADAEYSMSGPALERRNLVMGAGRPVVTEEDLPLAPSYLEGVLATGAQLRQMSRWLNAASFEATEAQLANIEKLPFVARMDLVGRGRSSRIARTPEEIEAALLPSRDVDHQAKALGPIDYGYSKVGLDLIAVPATHSTGLSGAGVTIAIFDTGFDLDHEAVRDADVIATWDFVGNDASVSPGPGEPVQMGDHGTEMLSLVAGFSPGNLIGTAYGASTILARTEDIDSETPAEEDNWIAALEWAEGLGVDIVCSGIGYFDWYTLSDMDGNTAAITVAAEMATTRGVCVVNSVGNERNNPDWPHLIPPSDGRGVIAVGAVDVNSLIAGFSSPGPTADGRTKPDVLGQGVRNIVAFPIYDGLYLQADGADLATAQIAGVAALMKERAPALTPIQIGEALRETASRSLLPDNLYGWGVTNALAAVNYWTPSIHHTPLKDQEGFQGVYTFEASIESRLEFDAYGPSVVWRVDDGHWQRAPMTHDGNNVYSGGIPALRGNHQVDYYLQASNYVGYTSTHPSDTPGNYHTFHTGIDETPPTIVHYRLTDQALSAWPPLVYAEAEDNLGIARLTLTYGYVGNPLQGPVDLEPFGDGWALEFPIPSNLVGPGLEIIYYLAAWDSGESPQPRISGPHTFRVVEDLGRVLFVNDRLDTPASKAAAIERGITRQSPGANKSTSAEFAQWLTEAGWSVDSILAEDAGIQDFRSHDAVIVSSGSNGGPMAYEELRQAMVIWEQEGGRLLVEGGEIAYVSSVAPDMAEIREKILHIEGWASDDGKALAIPPDLAAHPFFHRPNKLPVGIQVGLGNSGADFSSADVFIPDDEVSVILKTTFGTRWAGMISYDNNTGPEAGQILFMPFDLGKIESTVARALLENSMTYLTGRELPGFSSVSGKVAVAGRTDYSGVIVRCGPEYSAISESDGSYTIEGVWGGSYEVTTDLAGHLAPTRYVQVTDGMEVVGTDFYLVPVYPIEAGFEGPLPIPDNDPSGIDVPVEIQALGTAGMVSVAIDISHFSAGNLKVTLTSPSGTIVTLHNLTGGLKDDLIGSWPVELHVDGPGSLADFQGEPVQGDWILNVSDHAFGATGRINSWGLDLLFTPTGVSAAGDQVPAITRLVGNVPNPFNPSTTIQFELAAPGPIRVDVIDLRGRVVARLVDETRPAGSHAIQWNGRSQEGGEVASGVYFARFQAGNQAMVHKMMLVR